MQLIPMFHFYCFCHLVSSFSVNSYGCVRAAALVIFASARSVSTPSSKYETFSDTSLRKASRGLFLYIRETTVHNLLLVISARLPENLSSTRLWETCVLAYSANKEGLLAGLPALFLSLTPSYFTPSNQKPLEASTITHSHFFSLFLTANFGILLLFHIASCS